MGGLGKSLFGKEGEKSSDSGNLAFGPLMSAFSPGFGYFTQGGNAISSLLGLGGGGGSGGTPSQTVDMWHDGIDGNAAAAQKAGQPTSYTIAGTPGTAGAAGGTGGQTDALKNWADSGGMKFLMDQGSRMIDSNASAKGLLKSGSTLKGLEKYGMGLGSTYLQQYMDNLFKLSGLGLGAGQLVGDAGKYGHEEGTTGKQGMAGDLAKAGAQAYAASDRRLKENVVPLGDGLYEFDYKQNTILNLPKGRYIGWMADEVPAEALGPDLKGYKTVRAPYLPRKI